MSRPVAQYREFAPCQMLRGLVGAYFSFGPPTEWRPANRQVTREVWFNDRDARL